MNIRLVPSEAEAVIEFIFEIRVNATVRSEVAAFHGEKIKVQARLDVLKLETQFVVEVALFHRRSGGREAPRTIGKAAEEFRIHVEGESTNLLSVVSFCEFVTDRLMYVISEKNFWLNHQG
jgi:hypothetical protein